MRKFIISVLLLLSLTGCASHSLYGNFVKNSAQANDNKMADDAVKKLMTLYPPAKTRFDLQHVTPDFFGTYLVESMRTNGYAVLEFKPDSKATPANQASAINESPSPAGLSLAYIVDQPKDTGLHRVTLLINRQQSLDRVYQVTEDGSLAAAGAWVRKE